VHRNLKTVRKGGVKNNFLFLSQLLPSQSESSGKLCFYKYYGYKPQILTVEELERLEPILHSDEQTLPGLLSQAQQSINSGNALEDLASLLIALAGATQGVHASPLHYAYQADSWNARNAYRLHTCDVRPIDWRLRGAAEREGLILQLMLYDIIETAFLVRNAIKQHGQRAKKQSTFKGAFNPYDVFLAHTAG